MINILIFLEILKVSPNENFALDYNFALDNNLTKSKYDSIKTNFAVNNFITSFEYVDDKNEVRTKILCQIIHLLKLMILIL